MAEVYAGLDVSDKMTHVCVTDAAGAVVWAGACATDPEVITRTLKSRAPGLGRVILETGPLSAFLALRPERGAPPLFPAVNFREGWRGYLWQGRFASTPMDEDHLMAAARDDGVARVAPLLDRQPDWRRPRSWNNSPTSRTGLPLWSYLTTVLHAPRHKSRQLDKGRAPGL